MPYWPSETDPFAPDEAAASRTILHCPLCLQLPCTSDCFNVRLVQNEPRAVAADKKPPEAPPGTEATEGPGGHEWMERRDLV